MTTKSPPNSGYADTLTEVQQLAAAWNEDALLLLAGPGSGKTRVLTARIIRLFEETPNAHWRIAALTFTTRAGDEMRQRILQQLPSVEDRLFVGTFHAFACELLRQSGTHIGVRTDFNIYSDDRDRLLLLRKAIKHADIGFEGSLEKLLRVIDRMRERLVEPEESGRFLKDPTQSERFGALYAAYDKFLSRENVLDFPALIFRAYKLLENFPAIAEKYRRTYRYINVDEFQDTNSSQYRFLRLFTGDNYRNIFVVADDDQIIYQWNGASHKRLMHFQRDYAPQVFQMPTNFRCPKEVVVLANRLVAHNALRSTGKKPLIAGKVSPDKPDCVRLRSFETDDEEMSGIAAEIASQMGRQGTVAVLARTKALLEKAQRALHENGIRARLAQRRDEFVGKPHQALQLALELSNRPADVSIFEKFATAMNSLLKSELDTAEIASQDQSNHDDLLRTWCAEMKEVVIPIEYADFLAAIADHLAERRDYRKFLRAWTTWLNANRVTIEEQHPGLDEDARAWQDLHQEINISIGANAGLEAFLQELHLRSKEPKLTPDEMPLLTIHGSKGNEFDHVYLVGLAEDILPSFQSRREGPESPQMEEERRNCFVAITRCMETLTLSYAKKYRGYKKDRSRFLAEMGL